MTSLRAVLDELGACGEAVEWAGDRDADRSVWATCKRGDWMLWIAARMGVDRRLVVLAACDCAEQVLPIFERAYPKDRRPRTAIRVARAWARGRATLAQVRAAAYAANAAADAADAADAYAAAYAAFAAAYAADNAADAAAYAAYAARTRSLALSARLVRKRIPWATVRAALTAWEAGR